MLLAPSDARLAGLLNALLNAHLTALLSTLLGLMDVSALAIRIPSSNGGRCLEGWFCFVLERKFRLACQQ